MADEPTMQELQERLAASKALVAELQSESESEQRYKAFFEATNVALVILEFVLDEAGRPVDFRHIRINPALTGISGFKPDDILGRLVTEMAPPDEASEWIRFYGSVLTSGVPDDVERFSPAMGRWIKVSAAPFGPNQVAAVFENVTERKRAEVMVGESEARHRLLVGSWAQAVWETDASGVVIADSPSWRAYTGQTQEEWFGYGWLDAIHPDDRAYAERQWREAIAARGLVNAEFRLRAPDGGWRWTNVRAAPLLDARGDVAKWVGMNVDIDARIRAEAALRASDARYRQMLETMNAAFAAFEAVRGPDGAPVDFRISETDGALERLTGLSSVKVEGRLLTEILPESDARAWIDAFASVLASGEAAHAEHEIAALGRWFSGDIIPYGPDRVAHVYLNITDRKRTETMLRESKERQAFLLRLSDTLRGLGDARQIQQAAIELLGEQLAVNRAGYYEVGADQATFFLTGRWERGAPPLPERMLITDFGDEIREGYRAGRTMIARDTEQDAASEPNLAAVRALAIRAWIGVPLVKEGRWFAAVGVHSLTPRDWTAAEIRLVEEVGERTWAAVERARAEAALSESEEHRRLALESGGMGAWTWDTRNATIRSDAVVQALWGVSTSEQPHTVALYVDRMHPDSVAWLQAVAAKEKAPGEEVHSQLQVATGLGSTRWVQLRGRAERDTPWIINGVTFDITEQRLAEQRLAESEAKYAGLFEASPAPFLILEPDAPHFTITEVNEAYLAATMRTRDTVMGRGMFEAYPGNPDDAPGGGVSTLRASLERVLASKRPDALPAFKYDVARPDGGFEERWWSPVNSPVLDANGDVEAIIHNANDVTEEHRAEAALRASADRQAFLVSVGDALRPLTDPAMVAETACRLIGQRLGVERAYWAEVDWGTREFVVETSFHAEGVPVIEGRFPMDAWEPFTSLLLSGLRVVVANTQADARIPNAMKEGYRTIHVGADLVVPVLVDGRLPCTLAVNQRLPRNWTPEEIALVTDVAGRCWGEVERARAQAALRESELLFRTLAETAPALIWRNDAAGGNLFINQHFLDYSGKSTGELAGEGWRTIVHPDDADAYVADYLAAVREQRGWGNRNRILRHDGAWRWFENYARPLFDAQNRFLGHVGVSTDVDVSVRAEQAIRESEARWRALFEGMTEGFFTAEVIRDGAGRVTDYRYLQINPAFEKLTGVSPKQAVGRTALEVIPGLQQDLMDRYGRVVDTGESVEFEVQVAALNDRWYEARASRLGPAQFAVLFVEITDRKHNEQALRTADERKNEFLATLAHELRNPLAPLRTGLSILDRADGNSADAVRTRELMNRQLTHLVRLVDDLLDVSRVSQGKVVLKKAVHSLQSVVDLALETSRPLLDAAGHRLRVDLPAESVLLTVDATRIAQVLTNILNNAAKYTPSGGQLRLLAERAAPDRVRLQVEDNGMGISSDMLESVFDLFTQVNNRSGQSQGGLGIGLSLSRRLVELHGGTVRASSAGVGKGSTFTLELPAMPPRPPPDIPERAGDAASVPTVARKSVLVVDDNVDAAEMLAMVLELDGHKVRVVHTGNDALAAFGPDEAPDVVFLDIGLPDRSGYEVARELRRRRAFDRTVLVALTGWGADRDQQRAREAGFDAHLTKPVSPDDLGKALASHLPLATSLATDGKT